jgi:murein DD-endopeptidase MepM/ murein hydrolase activator NlpD
MDPEPQDPEGTPSHRPLPSVNMPLLRDQLRASKARRAGALVAALVGTGAIAGAFALGASGEDDAVAEEMAELDAGMAAPIDDEAELEAVAAEDAVPGEDADDDDDEAAAVATETAVESGTPSAPTAVERRSVLFGQARSFRHALVAAGLSRDECTALETSLDGVLDFRRCQPDDRMFIERDASGGLVRFEYHPDNTEYVVSRRSADGSLASERVTRPIDHIRIVRVGRVQSSIGEALEQAGLGRSLVGVFVDVFGGRANFNTDTRAGDTFRIVVDEDRLDGTFLRYGTVHAIEYEGSRTGTLQAFYYETSPGDGDYYDATGRSLHGSWLRTPLRYDHISSPFDPNRLHPILRRVKPHNGVDLAAGTGTPVWAAAAGIVTWAGPKGPNGNLIAIRHDGGYQSFYAHLHRIEAGITRGVHVAQRQVIGQVGTTGRSTGPHLHFGLKRGSAFLDPMAVINGPGRMLPAGHLGAFRRHARALARELEAAGRRASRTTVASGEGAAL